MSSPNCRYCGDEHFIQNGSGDTPANNPRKVTLAFESGNRYVIPANLPHLVIEHMYTPPTQLVGDVMIGRFLPLGAVNAHANQVDIEIGDDFPIGSVPTAFPYRLREIIEAALRHEATETP